MKWRWLICEPKWHLLVIMVLKIIPSVKDIQIISYIFPLSLFYSLSLDKMVNQLPRLFYKLSPRMSVHEQLVPPHLINCCFHSQTDEFFTPPKHSNPSLSTKDQTYIAVSPSIFVIFYTYTVENLFDIFSITRKHLPFTGNVVLESLVQHYFCDFELDDFMWLITGLKLSPWLDCGSSVDGLGWYLGFTWTNKCQSDKSPDILYLQYSLSILVTLTTLLAMSIVWVDGCFS